MVYLLTNEQHWYPGTHSKRGAYVKIGAGHAFSSVPGRHKTGPGGVSSGYLMPHILPTRAKLNVKLSLSLKENIFKIKGSLIFIQLHTCLYIMKFNIFIGWLTLIQVLFS